MWWRLAILMAGLTAAEPEECQPKTGVYRHQPQFHVIAPMFNRGGGTIAWPGGVNDANAVFQHRGIYHLMHQCDGGPPGVPCGGGWEGPNQHPVPGEQTYYHSWGHVVSTDLCHWRRITDALTPNLTDYEHGADCDGSISFLDSVGPVMLYGPGCGWKGGVSELGDNPVVALAVPANSSDPLLAKWIRHPDRPLSFADGSPPCSFAGSVWRHNTTHWSMVCTSGATRARYTALSTPAPTAGLEGPWSLADKAFGGGGSIGGQSGPAFFPLPSPRPGEPTHIISAGSKSTYAAAVYNHTTDTLTTQRLTQLDFGNLGWTAAGLADDGRVLLTGWVTGGHDDEAEAAGCPNVVGIAVCGVQAEAGVRVISYDPVVATLASYPVREITMLRNATLANESSYTLSPNQPHDVVLPQGTGAVIDVEVQVALPPIPSAELDVTLQLFAPTTAGTSGAGVNVSLEVGPAAHNGARTATVNRKPGNTFEVVASEATLAIRALVDRSIVEAFFAGGRAAFTARAYSGEGETGVRLFSRSGATVQSTIVHEMGCGWIED
eukprot:m.204598 g.204598  ORF g.204598 m.204598 type:complete len:549 (-) comp15394_c0_seq4:139-1785(-)